MSSSIESVRVGRVFTGEAMLVDAVIECADGRITSIETGVPRNRPVDLQADELMAVPGFIDLQVNGGGGRLFGEEPSVETLETMWQALAAIGTTNFLPTVITGPDATMIQARDAVTAFRADGRTRVLGIHFEGPEISPHQVGVHSADQVRTGVDWEAMLPPDGVRLVTLAPEVVGSEEIARLHSLGAKVSMGHTNATYDQACAAITEGVHIVTHLFNASGELTYWQPGAIGACLEDDRMRVGVIADGVHCHPALLRLIFALKPAGSAFIVSDALAPLGTTISSFHMSGDDIEVRDGACWRKADGVLAGAAVGLDSAVRLCVRELGLPLAEALRMVSLYPARVAGCAHQLGRLEKGFRACAALLDENLVVKGIIADGCLRLAE